MLAGALGVAALLPLSANAGAYVEAQGGYTQLDTNKNINANDNNIGHFSYGLRAGYSKNVTDTVKLGLEVGANDLGESKFGANKLSQQSLDLLATAGASVADNVDVFVKAGAARVEQKATVAGAESKKTETKPMLGLGVAYDLNEQVALTGTVEHVFADEVNTTNFANNDTIASSTGVNVGLRVKFDV